MSKLLACGDLHITESTPGMRTEDDFFYEVIVPKLEWLVATANEHEATICIAGDLFDKASTRYELTNKVSSILRNAAHRPIAVPGQHDMNYHSEKMIDTPYYTLTESGIIEDINCEIIHRGELVFEGAGFGVAPSTTMPQEPDDPIDVLITHFCIAEKDPPWFLTGAMSALSYLKAYPAYKLIISGDYHVPHVTKYKGRLLVNCGPLFRKEKTQIDFKPVVHLIDTADNSCKSIKIPIRAGSTAFDLDKIEKSKSMGLSQDDGMDTSTLKELLANEDSTSAEFPAVVSMVCTQFTNDRDTAVPMDRLNSIMKRAQSNG